MSRHRRVDLLARRLGVGSSSILLLKRVGPLLEAWSLSSRLVLFIALVLGPFRLSFTHPLLSSSSFAAPACCCCPVPHLFAVAEPIYSRPQNGRIARQTSRAWCPRPQRVFAPKSQARWQAGRAQSAQSEGCPAAADPSSSDVADPCVVEYPRFGVRGTVQETPLPHSHSYCHAGHGIACYGWLWGDRAGREESAF